MKFDKFKNYRYCKFVGSAVLLISFFTQWTLITYSQNLKNEWELTSRLKSNTETHALLCQLMYLSTKSALGTEDSVWLKRAAEKNFLGTLPTIWAKEKLTEREKLDTANKFSMSYHKIQNLDDYNDYSIELNKLYEGSAQVSQKTIARMSSISRFSLWIYVLFYSLGSSLIVYGLWLEYKNNNDQQLTSVGAQNKKSYKSESKQSNSFKRDNDSNKPDSPKGGARRAR